MFSWYSDFRILASRIERLVGVKPAQFVEISCATLEINTGEKSQRRAVVSRSHWVVENGNATKLEAHRFKGHNCQGFP